jgi:hypothetical protein
VEAVSQLAPEAPATPGKRALRLALWCSPLVVAWLFHLPICPYAIVLHEPCPGCGITRAAEALLRLDLAGAMAMNPIAPVVVPLAAALGLEAAAHYVLRGRTKLNERRRMILGISLCAALAVVWFARKYAGAFGGPVAI